MRSAGALLAVITSLLALAVSASGQAATKSVTVSLKPVKITADGHAQTTATAKVSVAGKPVTADTIAFTSSDGGDSIGPVTNGGNGTYTATITSSHTVGSATITATDTSDMPAETARATLTHSAPAIGVTVKPSKIPANGKSSALVSVKLTGAQGEPVPGEHVTVQSTGPALAGFVQDAGNGIYTASITATQTVGKVTITATDASVSPTVSDTVSLTTTLVQCVVPKLVGDSLSAAEQALSKANCTTGKLTHRRSSKVHKGDVISSSPSAGAKAALGAAVDLIVSSGARKICVVPRLEGKTLAAAKRALRRAHCRLGRIKHRASRTVRQGRVISSVPGRGKHRRRHARIELVISRGRH